MRRSRGRLLETFARRFPNWLVLTALVLTALVLTVVALAGLALAGRILATLGERPER